MRTSTREEQSREPSRANHSSRTRPPLQPARALDALGRRGRLHLSAHDRPRLLVSVALLGRGDSRRGAGFADAASLGRAHLLRGSLEYVRDVGSADEADRCGQKWWGAVKYYSTNQDDKMPPAGPCQA